MSDSKIYDNAAAPLIAVPGWYVLAVLSLLMGFGSISTDLYLPAMPEMSRALQAQAGMLELTISGYLIGFSLGQLLWGPISDRYGRRLSVATGLVLFVIGAAGCALSESALTLIAWRIVQALGACAGVALSRAMVRDLYEGNRAAQMLSTLMTVMAIAPLIGPTVGGHIVSYAGLFAYVAGTPFAYITYYQVPVRLYGLLFGFGIAGIMVASTLNARLVPRFGYDRMLLIGTLIAATSAAMTAVTAHTGLGGLWGLVASLFMFVSTTGFVVANSITWALADFPHRAGAVSALVGAFQYGFGIFGSGLVGAFSDGTPWPMGWVVAIAGIGSLLSMRLLAPAR